MEHSKHIKSGRWARLIALAAVPALLVGLLTGCFESDFKAERPQSTFPTYGGVTTTTQASGSTGPNLELLPGLPEELADIARLRLLYPEASLAQLAALTTPPLTKSGVNHRLQKILDFAQKAEIGQK